ncbi:MAG: pitrilysin family protein [Myxococcota bacterium]
MCSSARAVAAASILASLGLGVGCRATPTTETPDGIPPAAASQGQGQGQGAEARRSAPPRRLHEVEGITEYTLDNGLRVLLFPDPSRARVTVNVTYLVGSRHEGYGETGMAHLLEHMLFKGSAAYPEPWRTLEDHGADYNGTTWYDRTNYFETMPATPENLDWALHFEADRMTECHIDPAELAKEFSVVRNEFEMDENYAPGVLDERVLSTAFLWHNYGKSTIGARSDIENVPVSKLRRFYEKYYQPDNAVLVIAGAFEPEQALERVHEYFGAIPRPERALDATYTVEPIQDGERTVSLERVGDVGVVNVLFHGVAGADPDYVAGEALAHLLTDEPSGRLYQALVETGLAASVYGDSPSLHDPGWVQVTAEVPAGLPLEPVRDRIFEVLDEVREGVDEVEVARFRNRRLKQLGLAMTDSTEIAIELSEWAALGDWRMFFVYRDRLETVQPEQVRDFAQRFVVPSNRTVGLFVPAKAPVRAPLVEAPDVDAVVRGYQGRAEVRAGEHFVATIDNIEAHTERAKTSGGISLAMLPKKTRGGAVTLRLRLRAGSLEALRGKATAAEMVGDMVLRGTTEHSRQQLRDEFDRLRADVWVGGTTAGAWVEVTTVHDSVPEVVALLAEVLRSPSFPAGELDVLRRESLAGLQASRSDPTTRAYERLWQVLSPYAPDDPRYAPTVDEQIARLKKVRRRDLVRLHRDTWGAGNFQITAVGDFDPAALRQAVEQHLEGWAAEQPYQRLAFPHHDVPGRAPIVIDTPDKEMAVVVMGQTFELRDDDPDYPALLLANFVLGGASDSRLVTRLREREGWSYSAYASLDVGAIDRGSTFTASAQCAPQNLDKVHAAMLEEIERMLTEGIAEAELTAAKESYRASFETQLTSDGVVADRHLSDLFLDRTLAFTQAENEAIEAVTPQQLRDALQRHLKMDGFVTVLAGDMTRAKQAG